MSRTGNGTQIAERPRTELVNADGEVLDLQVGPTALESITRAEIDVQVATAKKYPRSMTKFMSEAKGMVALDPDLAAQCTFVLPTRKKNDDGTDGGPITGPSVRLAEMLAICWGNLRITGRITDDDGKFITAQAVALDLERNVGYAVEVKRGVTFSPKARYNAGARYTDDMIKTTCNAAIAIVTRNATFKVIPRAFVNMVQEEAQRVATGDVKTLPERTHAALGWFAGKGIREDRVFTALGIGGPADMTLDKLMTLHGYRTAVKEGLTTLDEIFATPKPPDAAPAPGESKSAALAERIAPKGKRGKAEPAPAPADLGWVHGEPDAPQTPPVAAEDVSQDDGDPDIDFPDEPGQEG